MTIEFQVMSLCYTLFFLLLIAFGVTFMGEK